VITCPWCGTNYPVFQTNCKNCGGPLPFAEETPAVTIPAPPPAPRNLPGNYVWRMLPTDGWSILAFVFTLLGGIFTVVGFALTVSIVTAFVGIPFLFIGLPFLGAGIAVAAWRYRQAQQVLQVLRIGEAVLGQITDTSERTYITINERHPWTISYRFQIDGSEYIGAATTLRTPDWRHQPGQAVWVLYLPDNPMQNTIYPPVM